MTEQTQILPTKASFLKQAWSKLWTTLEMIKFEHSVFALPFALTGAMLAAGGWPSWRQLFWIAVAMVGARSAAMAFNRIADRDFDAQNPRTQSRALPAGLASTLSNVPYNGKPLARVCVGTSCQPPTSDPEELTRALTGS